MRLVCPFLVANPAVQKLGIIPPESCLLFVLIVKYSPICFGVVRVPAIQTLELTVFYEAP